MVIAKGYRGRRNCRYCLQSFSLATWKSPRMGGGEGGITMQMHLM